MLDCCPLSPKIGVIAILNPIYGVVVMLDCCPLSPQIGVIAILPHSEEVNHAGPHHQRHEDVGCCNPELVLNACAAGFKKPLHSVYVESIVCCSPITKGMR